MRIIGHNKGVRKNNNGVKMTKQFKNGNIKISAANMAVLLGQIVALTSTGKSYQDALSMVCFNHNLDLDESIFNDAITIVLPHTENGKSREQHKETLRRLDQVNVGSKFSVCWLSDSEWAWLNEKGE